jgi:hypothetical protein
VLRAHLRLSSCRCQHSSAANHHIRCVALRERCVIIGELKQFRYPTTSSINALANRDLTTLLTSGWQATTGCKPAGGQRGFTSCKPKVEKRGIGKETPLPGHKF